MLCSLWTTETSMADVLSYSVLVSLVSLLLDTCVSGLEIGNPAYIGSVRPLDWRERETARCP